MLMSTESQCWGSGWRIAERSDGILPFFRLWELIVTRASTENPPPSYRKHAWLPVLALGVYIRVDLKVVIGPVCISGNMYSDALLSVVMPRSKGYPVVSCVCLSEAHPCPSPADGLYARQRYQRFDFCLASESLDTNTSFGQKGYIHGCCAYVMG